MNNSDKNKRDNLSRFSYKIHPIKLDNFVNVSAIENQMSDLGVPFQDLAGAFASELRRHEDALIFTQIVDIMQPCFSEERIIFFNRDNIIKALQHWAKYHTRKKENGQYETDDPEYFSDLEKIAEFYRREAEKSLRLLKEATRWYSAESELPKESGTYLVVGKSKSVHIAHFYKEHTVNGVTYPAHFSSKHVRWWAHRPAPPLEETK